MKDELKLNSSWVDGAELRSKTEAQLASLIDVGTARGVKTNNQQPTAAARHQQEAAVAAAADTECTAEPSSHHGGFTALSRTKVVVYVCESCLVLLSTLI